MMGRKSDALAMSLMDDLPPVPDDVVQQSGERMDEYEDFPEPSEAGASDASIYSNPFECEPPIAQVDLHEEATNARRHNDALDMTVAHTAARRAPYPNNAAEAARLSVVRDYHQQISPNDSLYFVMTFIERAGQQIASDLGEQLRMQGVDVVNCINDAAAAAVRGIATATTSLVDVQQGFSATAHTLGGKLRATGEHVLKEIAKDRDVVVPMLKQQLVDDLTGDEGELEQVKRQMRKELPGEVRLAIKTAVATEVTLLQVAMMEAASALTKSAAASKARAKNGWLKNVADDLKALADEKRYLSIVAVTGVVLFGGYLLTRVVTGIVH